jgi:hypothetical protein
MQSDESQTKFKSAAHAVTQSRSAIKAVQKARQKIQAGGDQTGVGLIKAQNRFNATLGATAIIFREALQAGADYSDSEYA